MNDAIVFDIETGPLPENELRAVYVPPQFQPPPGRFDPASVKLGNTKDQKLVEAKIEEARQKHQHACDNYESTCAGLAKEHWADFVDKAALSAFTGRVLAIGVMGLDKRHTIFDDDDEQRLLEKFWLAVDFGRNRGRYIGFNIEGFDIPFLVRRSWRWQLDPPDWAVPAPWFSQQIVDLRKRWTVGNRNEQKGTLDEVCRFFGLPGKLEGVTGGDFAKLWASDRPKAKEYLHQDLLCTLEVARRMGAL